MEKLQLPVVMALIKNEQGQILAQVRNQPDFPEKHAKWELTGGKIEFYETPEQAIVREVKEETGLDVEVVSLFPKVCVENWKSEDKNKEWQCVLITYVCKIIGGELHNPPQDPKISELSFINPEDIEKLEWGNHSDKDLILDYLKH